MLRFDDQFPIHRKLAGLSDAGFRLHVEAIFWCARHLTDGVVGQEELDTVSAKLRRPIDLVPSLAGRDAWHRFEDGQILANCDECKDRYGPTLRGDGWIIHGYLDWQQTRSKVLLTREARKRAGKLGGQRSASVRAARKGTSKPTGKRGSGSKNEAGDRAGPIPFAQPPHPLPSTKEGGDARPASPGAARVPEPDPPHSPNWRPDYDAIERAAVVGDQRIQRAAAARAAIRTNTRPDRPPPGAALDALRAATPDAPVDPPAEEQM